MADYCTITDVNALVPQSPFTAGTVPSQAQVEGYIRQITNRVNAILPGIGYTVPVLPSVTPDPLASPPVPDPRDLLREACAWGSLGLAQQSRVTAVAADQNVGLSVWTKMFNDWMKDLMNPNCPFELPNCARTGRAVVKPVGEMERSTANLSDSSFSYLTDPPFTMGQKL